MYSVNSRAGLLIAQQDKADQILITGNYANTLKKQKVISQILLYSFSLFLIIFYFIGFENWRNILIFAVTAATVTSIAISIVMKPFHYYKETSYKKDELILTMKKK